MIRAALPRQASHRRGRRRGANRLGSPSFRSTAAEIALGPCAEAGDAARDYPPLVHGLDQLDRLVEALSLSGRPAAAP